MEPSSRDIAIHVWLITDNKPGHRNQLRGLVDRLQHIMPLRVEWIDISGMSLPWGDFFFGRWPEPHPSRPDLVIGAGSATHAWLLLAKRAFRAFTTVMMKPSVPLSLFDAAIIPQHDAPPDRASVLATRGVLNQIAPREQDHVASQNTLLIGGPSKHFVWDDGEIIEQISALLLQHPTKTWVLADSRRTPSNFRTLAGAFPASQVRYINHEETAPDWLPQQLLRSKEVWVSPDSVSMIYESLTSGAATGLFELDPSRYGRIHRGIDSLLNDGLCVRFADRPKDAELRPPALTLWEADRAAHWLKERFRMQHR